MPAGEIPGWFGKLPSLGDFASRRLSPAFIDCWDEWLASGLAEWRQRAASTWLDDYLAGPSWCFVLMPGVSPGVRGAWAGVLMPSVDKVGRYFPLTLAQPIAGLPQDAGQTGALLDWLKCVDDRAVAALHDDWTVEQLEAALADLGPWTVAQQPPTQARSGRWASAVVHEATLDLPPSEGEVESLAESAFRELHGPQGRALWMCRDVDSRPVLRVSNGLPRGTDFSALWTRRGTNLADNLR